MGVNTHNLFSKAVTAGFTVPDVIIDDFMAKLPATTVLFYIYLIRQSKRANSPVFNVLTTDAENTTGLNRHTQRKAREILTKFELVRAEEPNKKGLWKYEILNPVSGQSLPLSAVKFANLSDKTVIAFYEHFGRQRASFKASGGFKIRCSFCSLSRVTLSVNLQPGSDDNGAFSCSKCHAQGGMIKFLQKVEQIRDWGEATKRTLIWLRSYVHFDEVEMTEDKRIVALMQPEAEVTI